MDSDRLIAKLSLRMLSKKKQKIAENDVRAELGTKNYVGFEFTVRSSLDLGIEDL